MSLSNDLITQFVKITNDNTKSNKESTVYGTTVEYNGSTYVKLDGSELLTPITTTADTKPGERVVVMIKNHTATITGNISSPAARLEDVNNINLEKDSMMNKITEFEIAIGGKADVQELNAANARIDTLVSDNVTIRQQLTAVNADIDKIVADNIEVSEKLTANEAAIDDLKANTLTVEVADARYLTAGSLDATNADIRNLEADFADINTLIFGSATGDVIQTSFSNAVIAQLGDAQIKSAMIESISASKITAGDIITNNVRVRSEDGSLLISDETMQISDSTRVRVQIGKDASNDYSINIWDADGNLMFSKGGITDNAIKSAIIRNDMVSDTANIAAHKLDIDSLFDEINGSTNTIKSTKVYLDDKNQTLDVSFKALSDKVTEQGNTITSQGTQISTIQGQITSKIWQQDINTAVNGIEVGGRNLYIVKNAVDGYLSSSGDGTITPASPYTKEKTSDFIPVNVGDDMRFQLWVTTPDTSYIWYAYQFFKEDKTALDTNRPAVHLYDMVGGAYHVTYDPIVVPEGASYIRVSARMFEDGKIKVERGNKPTDWTPAPEDVEGDITELSSKYSSIEQTVSSISTTVASHESKINNKADSSTVTAVNDKVTTLEQNLSGFKTTVSNTYATKTELSTTNQNVETISSRMESAESTIEQQADSIALCATKTEVSNSLANYSTTSQMNSAIQVSANNVMSSVSSTYATKATVNGIEIGSRNLYIIKNSEEGFLTVGSTTLAAMNNTRQEHTSEYIAVREGDNYMFQVWTTVDEADTTDPNLWMAYDLYDADKAIMSNRPAKRSTNELPNGQYYDVYSIAIPTGVAYIRVSARLYSDGLIKLEKGNKATGWTPAPEDIESEITNLDSRVTSAESSITQLSNRITANVTETTNLGTRMTTVEQTSSALTTRIANTETLANNAAKTATNYLNFSSSGLVVGDMTASTLGKNVRITSSTVDVREGSTTLASFGADTIYLGKNSETAVINLCNGSATMRSVDDSDFKIYTDKRLVMSAYSSALLDCWRDSTHMTRISLQSADPDASYMWGGIFFTIYQDTVQNTFDMSNNTTEFKITDGTNEAIVDLDETRLRVRANNTQINCTNGLYVGYDGSYAAKITLGYKYLQDKSIRWYWSDNALHDAFSNSNGQITYVGPGDIDETTTTMIRGQYVRLYAHNGGAVYLGYSGSTAVTSDRNMKTDILDIDDKYLDFFDRLRPITYKYDAPEHKGHRDHVGFVAQEVEEALIASGLTTEQFAGLVIEKDVALNPNHDSSLSDEENAANETHYDTLYSLRYEEFISLLVKKVQSLQEQINQLGRNS